LCFFAYKEKFGHTIASGLKVREPDELPTVTSWTAALTVARAAKARGMVLKNISTRED
jgi:hypothetical protein